MMEMIENREDRKTNAAKESKLIEGYFISDGMIYNKDFSALTEDISVEQLPLSPRSYNCIRRAGIHTLSKLLQTSVEELANIKNMGAKSKEEILSVTEEYLYKKMESVIGEITECIDDLPCDETTALTIEDSSVCDDTNALSINDISICDYTDALFMEDIPLGILSLPVRITNAMARGGYQYIHEIANFTYDDFRQIKNMGDKSAREIYEKVHAFLKDYHEISKARKITADAIMKAEENTPKVIAILKSFCHECEACGAKSLIKVSKELLRQAQSKKFALLCTIGELTDVYNNPSVVSDMEIIIIGLLAQRRIEGLSQDEIKAVLPVSLTNELLTKQLNKLTEKGVVRHAENYYAVYPSFSDVLAENADDRAAQIISMRIQQKTYEEIAQEVGGLTRERIRQIVSIYMGRLFSRYEQMDEDKYKYIFTTYALNQELMEKYLGFSAETIYFLKYKYKGTNKKLPIDETALDDPMLPASIKKQIEKYIFSKKIRIGNEYVEARRHLVEEALLPVFCKNTLSAYDFINQYNEFVTENQKPELLITDDLYRSRLNKYASSSKILWTLNQKMRYYDTESINKSEFLERLNLNKYHAIEISSKKIFDENSDLMAEYDIRNEYELHNLLKKVTPKDYPELEFSRTPMLQFGKADRERQVVDLLVQLTPIHQFDFADAYAELYGVQPVTVLANYIPYVKQYLNKDRVLEMDVPSLTEEQLERLKALLPNDVYSMERLLSIFRREYPTEPVEKINHYTLHQLGFHVYSGYVVSLKYRNAQEYFRAILSDGNIINANLFPQDFVYIQAYSSTLASLLENRDLIEFLPKKYIKTSRLTELFGTTKEDIKQFCRHVNEYTDKPFFTVQSLKKYGFDDPLFELGFDNCFYSSLLFYDREFFAHKKVGGTTIFKVGTQLFVFSDFIEWLLYREESMSMDVYELTDLLYDNYGIRFDRHDIKSKILPGTQMYYSDITEKLYADYEIYFDEI